MRGLRGGPEGRDGVNREVAGHRGRKVVITSRGSEPASDFKLIGSGRIADGIDDPLADIRRDANALWEKQRRRGQVCHLYSSFRSGGARRSLSQGMQLQNAVTA
jgi:hypothetical protein